MPLITFLFFFFPNICKGQPQRAAPTFFLFPYFFFLMSLFPDKWNKNFKPAAFSGFAVYADASMIGF